MNAIDLFDDEFTLSLLAQAPLVLVYLAAILGAVLTWRRNPRASALAMAGAVILLIISGFGFFWEFLLLDLFDVNEMLDFIDLAMIWGTPLVQAFGTALLVAAIFVGRRAPRDDDMA